MLNKINCNTILAIIFFIILSLAVYTKFNKPIFAQPTPPPCDVPACSRPTCDVNNPSAGAGCCWSCSGAGPLPGPSGCWASYNTANSVCPAGGPTPNPTSPPFLPTPTLPGGPSPTLPPPGWYAPDGSQCNRTNYYIYYTGSSCTAEVSYATEGISPQSQCSRDGTGKCFQVGGAPFAKQISSLWRFDSQACVPVTSPYTPPNMFNTLFQCRWGIPPVSTINGNVTVNFFSFQQFDKIYVWLTDSLVNYSRFIELDKANIRIGQPYPYTFNYLFPNRKYDVYVKAYGPSALYLDNVTYDSSCGSPGCRVNPTANVNFKLTFPRPIAGSSQNQITNQAFQQAIDQWIKGQIGPLQMSLFIKQIARVPGLQKATCDPRVPNGCSLY